MKLCALDFNSFRHFQINWTFLRLSLRRVCSSDICRSTDISSRFFYVNLCIHSINYMVLCHTYSTNSSAAFTYFRHVGELTYFHIGVPSSILWIDSNCTWTESIIFWDSESGARFASRHPRRVSRAINTIAVEVPRTVMLFSN